MYIYQIAFYRADGGEASAVRIVEVEAVHRYVQDQRETQPCTSHQRVPPEGGRGKERVNGLVEGRG